MSSDDVLAGLDPQQRAAAGHLTGPALVVAGAGAGKTTVLVRRVAHLVRSGVPASSILLLTFTRAAARSIVQRARAFSPACDNVLGGTFHSVAARVIRDSHATFGLPPGFTVLDPDDVHDILKRLADFDPKSKGTNAATVARDLSFAVNTRKDGSECLDAAIERAVRDRFPKDLDKLATIQRLAKAYIAYKKERDLLDFDDLLEYFAALAEHPQTGPGLRARFPYVMVDEHQDSNALQLRIVLALGGDGGNVMCVGDPAQSIYRFRGAAPSTLGAFVRHWPNAALHVVETNYRSTPEIVAAANLIDQSMADRFDRVLRSSRDSIGSKAALVHVPDIFSEAEYIARAVVDLRDDGAALRECAVLVRTMRHARHVEAALNAHGIPYIFLGGIRIYEAAHIKDVLSVLRIVVNPSDEPAWLRLLGMMPHIGSKSASRIFDSVRGAGPIENVLEALDALAAKRPELLPAASALRKAHAETSPSAALAVAADGLGPSLMKKWGEEWEWRRKDIDAIVDLAGSQSTTEEFLRTVTIDVSVDKRSDGRPAVAAEDVMTVATIHSAKGLEWDHVWIPSFIDGHLPSSFARDKDETEEEKRLCYVAVTRARRHLSLMRPVTAFVHNQQVVAAESVFEPILRPALVDEHPKAKKDAESGIGGGVLINMR